MIRRVSAQIQAQVTQPAEIVFSVAVAQGADVASETLSITVDGVEQPTSELLAPLGTRLHLVRAALGELRLEYSAEVTGKAVPLVGDDGERIIYLRPSRYAESDRIAAVARAEFDGLTGKGLLDAVSSWVGAQLAYVSGSSRPIDGAVDTYLARQGVCRDFAHLVVALLRSVNVPARLVSVYAPGLDPMDFHAVAEAWLDGSWNVVDATALAPRSTMLRIATGRDAADTAFMTVQSGLANLGGMAVTATVDPALPADDMTVLHQLH